MTRKRLVEQYPGIPQVSASNAPSDDPQKLFMLVQPYLNWRLAKLEMLSMDILIYKQGTKETPSKYLILRGLAANAWLFFQRGARARV